MRLWRLVGFTAVITLSAQVRFTPDKIDISVDGKPFTTFHFGADAGKPYLAPLRSATGKIVTRRYPMEKIEGESHDHPHHRGLWFSYDDVNGTKFWENDPSYTNPKIGHILATKAHWKDATNGGAGTLGATMEWRDPQGAVLLVEDRTMLFHADPALRIVDFDIKLTAAQPVTFGDTKEGAFAIRLADSLAEKKGGTMVNAEGQSGMANVWGKRSAWVDYSGEVDGEKLGVAIFDHPGNERYPTYWHSRDYGLFALDPFGRKAFDKSAEESKWSIGTGQWLRFRWRVVIHPGDTASARIADLYKQYASGK